MLEFYHLQHVIYLLQLCRKILQHELAVATGGESNLNQAEINPVHHAKFVEAILALIKADTDIQKIQVKNTADVLTAIGKGQMTIVDAKEMVSLFAMINGDVGKPEENSRIIIEIAKGRDPAVIEVTK